MTHKVIFELSDDGVIELFHRLNIPESSMENYLNSNHYDHKPMNFSQYISELFNPIKKVLLVSELENSL